MVLLHILENVQSRVALTHFIYYKVVGMFRYGKWRLRRELYLTRVRGKYRDLLQAPRAKARVAFCAVYLLISSLGHGQRPVTLRGCR